jgi:hypothetical protein
LPSQTDQVTSPSTTENYELLMGTWAVGSFENDTALDWLTKVYESGDLSGLRAALIGDFKNAQPYRAVEALAAADLVACFLGHAPPEPKRKGLVEWTQKHPDAFTPELFKLARDAVRAIKSNSKLRDSWKGRDGSIDAEWLAAISDLETRLQTGYVSS